VICIPITAPSKQKALHDIERSCLIADAIELRMDLIVEGSLEELIAAARSISSSVRIIVTCRKKEEAAWTEELKFADAETSDTKAWKIKILKKAIELGTDYVDIELSEGRALIDEMQSYCEKQGGFTRIIVSYHNIYRTPALSILKKIFHQCRESQPAIVKIVTLAKTPQDNLKMLSLIPYAQKRRQEIIALCMGEVGRISRIIAPFLGNYLSFAALDKDAQSAPGQYTVQDVKRINSLIADDSSADEPLHLLSPNYVLLGNPVQHSLSPLMHNAALTALGIPGHYHAFCVKDLAGALEGIRGMDIRGASVTIPFKSAVLEYLDNIDDDALKVGAVNTILNNNGRLTGFNTDWWGLVLALQEVMEIKGKKFVIIGAGGTTKAAAYGIMKEGGFPVLVNRTPEKAEILARKLNCPFYDLSAVGRIKADCLLNTTPVGMYPDIGQSPAGKVMLAAYEYVIDVIYNPLKTQLLKDAEEVGCHIVSGLNMFVHQGAEQIKLWTGQEPDRVLMKKIVADKLSAVA